MTGDGVPEDASSGAARPIRGEPARGGGPGATSDDVLLGRVATGDLDALTELYDRYRTMAYAIALRITGSVPTAEDVLQDAFLGVWRHAARYEPARGTPRSWLLSIVHHRAIDVVRRRRVSAELPDPETTPPPAMVVPDVWPEVAGRLDAAAVRAALDRLPAAQREAIELAYWSGLTQPEIAERTATPLGTVKSRIRLGLLSLRRELTAAEGSSGGGPLPAVRSAAGSGEGGERRPGDEDGGRLWVVRQVLVVASRRSIALLGRRLIRSLAACATGNAA